MDLKLPEINECRFSGRLVRDAELRYIPSGTAVLKFSIAVDRRYKKGDEQCKDVVFPSIVVWGKHAEYLAGQIKKGTAVLVDRARMEQRKWEDKQGNTQHATEYNAEKVHVLEWPVKDDAPTQRPAQHDDAPIAPSYGPPDDDDQVPF